MNILMMTNTYTPIVGGLERSVRDFKAEFQKRGHRVLVAAPEFEDVPRGERDVIRLPAIQHFNGSDFSVKLPVPRQLSQALLDFKPDIIHAHHPFLMGNTALRLAHTHRVPLIFTHHTLFEQYTHYVPGDSPVIQRFVVELSTGYANLCEHVFAPSESVEQLLRERGVERPISVVPTGVDVTRFARGSRTAGRAALGLSPQTFVVGHIGRLAPEKNLEFLARGVAAFLATNASARFVVVGQGPSEETIRQIMAEHGMADRVQLAGVLSGQRLIDAYRAMDVFAFASKSETQGLVVTEALAAKVPVVAIDAPGVREVVEDGRNGRLLPDEQIDAFAEALAWVAARPGSAQRALSKAAFETAERFAMPRCADRALMLYAGELNKRFLERRAQTRRWIVTLRRVKAEWEVLKTVTKATTAAVTGATPPLTNG